MNIPIFDLSCKISPSVDSEDECWSTVIDDKPKQDVVDVSGFYVATTIGYNPLNIVD